MKYRVEKPKPKKLGEHHKKQLKQVVHWTGENLPDQVKAQLCGINRHEPGLRRIAILYSGGTIGMKQDIHHNLVPTNNIEEVLEPFERKGMGTKIKVVWFQVFEDVIDSTNARWHHWVTLGNAIRLLYDDFDGFVVVGGTDTMSYACASLKFMFPELGKPIVATGAQKSIFELGDDATRNLTFAILAACENISGVFLAFADKLRDGIAVFKVKDKDFDAFDGPQEHLIGTFNGNVNVFGKVPERKGYIDSRRLKFDPGFMEGIKVHNLSPSTPPGSFMLDLHDPWSYVTLLITYGAGNIRNLSSYPGEPTDMEVVRYLRLNLRPVVLGSSIMDGSVDSPYATGAEAVAYHTGAISAANVNGAALEIKMMRCIYNAVISKEEMREFHFFRFRTAMYQNHVGELTGHEHMVPIRPVAEIPMEELSFYEYLQQGESFESALKRTSIRSQ